MIRQQVLRRARWFASASAPLPAPRRCHSLRLTDDGRQPKRKPRPGVDKYGRTALHYAALEGTLEAVDALLSAGEDVNARDDNGMTPLMFATQQRRPDVLDLLVLRGADPNLVDLQGNDALWRAVLNAQQDPSIVAALIRAGANPDIENNHGQTARKLAQIMGLRLF